MTYAFIQDVPVDRDIYGQIRARLGNQPPKGLIAHIATTRDGGLRYLDVWDSEDDWKRFGDDVLEPAVDEVLARAGLAHDHSRVRFQPVEVVDAWLG